MTAAMETAPPPTTAVTPILSVEDLTTVFSLHTGRAVSVNGVSFDVAPGEILAIVGESGSGKTVTGLSLMGLVDPPGRVEKGSVRLRGRELVGLDEEDMRALRGREVAMIFQDPMTTLNPVLTIGRQFYEVMRAHKRLTWKEAMARAEQALVEVGMPAPAARLATYPHELSGGMRQRVCIALSLVNAPSLVIADEPTTALDVTIQAQILALMHHLVRKTGVALIWITHDLSIAAGFCDRIAVMYAGRIVEEGPVDGVLNHPTHPYTVGLLRSIPGEVPPGGKLEQIGGMPPSPLALPKGCAFRPRCFRASKACLSEPPVTPVAQGRKVRCFHPTGAA
ncbi:MAG: ABC transporter ATP-binding protein [Devosia sp.]